MSWSCAPVRRRVGIRAFQALALVPMLLGPMPPATFARDQTEQPLRLVQSELSELRQEVADKLKDLPAKIRQLDLELARTNEELERIRGEFQATQEKVEKVGLTEGIGLLLRRQLTTLPDVRRCRRNIRMRRPEMRAAQLSLIELDDDRHALADLDREASRKMAELRPRLGGVAPTGLAQAVRELLKERSELLDKLAPSQSLHFETLVKLDTAEHELINEAETYADYMREHVLWIRSTQVVKPGDVKPALDAVVWLLSPDGWAEVGLAVIPYGYRLKGPVSEAGGGAAVPGASDLGVELLRSPAPILGSVAFAVLFVVLLRYQRRFRSHIAQCGDAAARSNCQEFSLTLHALVCTCLLSLLWPSLLFFLAWRLSAAISPSEFVKALGDGLGATGAFFLSFEVLRQICRPMGLAAAHFAWPRESVGILHAKSRSLLLVGSPLVFVVTTLHGQSNQRWQDSLARACFIAALVAVSLLAHFLFRPTGALVRGFGRSAPDSWAYRLRRVFHWVALFGPLALAVLALAGYYYTAHELVFRLLETLWLLLGLWVFAELVLRWLLLNRRRLAMRRAQERRQVGQGQTTPTDQASRPPSAADEPELDLGQLSEQSRQLLKVSLAVAAVLGMWLIWVDMLPALGILERVTLWEATAQVREQAAAAGGEPAAAPAERRWITLQHLAVALLILGLMVLAVRNIPGLLELTVLQRLPLDAGTRYATTAITRYAIIIAGLVSAFRSIGIQWSQYQWLVAAATVGLGFGLQEIFANFVSGLIVLMERPIRVGDVVTVEGVTGTVTRVRMRATTVTNWDRQEFIVPNKEFVTGRLLNWTLSNATNRIVINVGVAYGSDTERARELLVRIAQEHPLILDDPAPSATLEGFGDSALQFVLRCFLPNLDHRSAVIHELHTEIHRRFAEAGIEIAFPQRDLRVRSWSSPPAMKGPISGPPPGA